MTKLVRLASLAITLVLASSSPAIAQSASDLTLPDEIPVIVSLSLQIQSINEIDDEAEAFEFSGVIELTWIDKRLAFDQGQNRSSEKLYTGTFQVDEIAPSWYPQLVIANVAGMDNRDAVLFRVAADGRCTLVQTVNAIVESKLDLRRYPFDRQRLDIEFEILGFSSEEAILQVPSTPSEVDSTRRQIPQWTVINETITVRSRDASIAGVKSKTSVLVVSIEVQRKSFFVIRLVLLPLLIIVLLSWSVFWMDPHASGDRLNVSFIGILTVVAYQLVVGDILPQIAYMTFIHSFLNFSFLLMCATVPLNLLIGSIERRGHTALCRRVNLSCRWAFILVYVLLISASIIKFFFA